MAPPRHHNNHHHHHHNHNNNNHHPSHTHQSAGAGGGASYSSGAEHGAASNVSFHSGHDEGSAGLPPAPNRLDTSQAHTYRLQDAYWSDDEEDMDCPLCLEEIDISDANFKPCPCGYQLCRFCWHHIKQNLNGRCPACRRKYTDNLVEFKPMSQEEIKRLGQAKKQKEREKRELEQMNRKHLANMRVVQKNLVYVVGMDPKLAREELIPTLRSNEYFGQYGRISKILISKRTTASKLVMGTQESSIGVYVTYVRKEDAARAIIAIDGSKASDGRTVRASYGTTKYCTTYLRNLPCANPICTYLHEPGEEADSFTKEDLTTLRHAAKDTEMRGARPAPTANPSFHAATRPHDAASAASNVGLTPSTPGGPGSGGDGLEASALPKTASWASGKPTMATATPTQRNAIQDADLPPLSAIANQHQNKRGGQQRAPASPIVAKSTPKSKHQNRSESPMLPRSATASPAPTAPPGLGMPSALARSGSSLHRSPKQEAKIVDEASNEISPGVKSAAIPPGSASRSNTPSADTASSASEPKTASNYQPSSNAQAVLDDMRARRHAETTQPSRSPFPDFDATLSSFRDGDDFCFTFEESIVPYHAIAKGPLTTLKGAAAASPALANAAFGAASAIQGSSSTPPPPGLGGLPTHASSASRTYSGNFDPFSSDAGLSVLGQHKSPLDSMKGLNHALNSSDQTKGDDGDGGGEAGSRFGFAKRKDAFRTPDDLLGFVKGGALFDSHAGGMGHQPAASQQPQNYLSSGLAPILNSGYASGNSDWTMGNANTGLPLQSAPNTSRLMQVQGNGYTNDGHAQSYRKLMDGGMQHSPATPSADTILLAQLMNRKPNEMMTYQDSSLAQFSRLQQTFNSQSPNAQNAVFSPFDIPGAYANGLSSTSGRTEAASQQHQTYADYYRMAGR